MPRRSRKESLTELGKRIGLTADRLSGRTIAAAAAGIHPSQLGRYIKGENQPPINSLARLADAAGVNLEWLATGEGSMKKGEPDAGAVIRTAEQLGDYYLIPRYDVRASAGGGALIDSEQIVDAIAFKIDFVLRQLKVAPGKLVLISAAGDSMEPEIRSGDLLLVDASDTRIRSDAIYVLSREGELAVKRLKQRQRDGVVLVISDNPAYKPDEEIPQSEVPNMRIVGRVIWVGGVI